MKRLHTLFLLLTIAIDIAAQPICQVKHFSVSDGLAQGNVMSILQDQKGLVWFSTWNGLNKFDGYTFKTYKTSQESKYAFGSNRMGTISESKYGDIWCPTYDGQACQGTRLDGRIFNSFFLRVASNLCDGYAAVR